MEQGFLGKGEGWMEKESVNDNGRKKCVWKELLDFLF